MDPPAPAPAILPAHIAPLLRTTADVTAAGPQRLWLDTITSMTTQPDADRSLLHQIGDWIVSGVTLDLDSTPPPGRLR